MTNIPHAKVLGISYHLPERVETNADLERENPDWQMEALFQKSGIAARRISAPSETASDLALKAAGKLLGRELVDPAMIDHLIFCTQGPDHYLPSAACVLQDRLKLGRHVGAFDFNLGCSGYIYGLQLAKALIASGESRNVLLLTADTYTKYIHPRDRSVRTLFGDGAAATLIGAGEGLGLGNFVVGTNGSGAMRLCVPAGGMRQPRSPESGLEAADDSGCVRSQDNLYMDGPALFTFAISTVPKTMNQLLAKAGTTVDDYDLFVFHQANKYMLDNLVSRCKLPADKMVYSFENIGNTVSSSIPIALQMAVEEGRVSPGCRLALVGFGVGFSWGGCELVWG